MMPQSEIQEKIIEEKKWLERAEKNTPIHDSRWAYLKAFEYAIGKFADDLKVKMGTEKEKYKHSKDMITRLQISWFILGLKHIIK